MEENNNELILEQVPKFTLNGLKTKARFCNIYDGDTCDVVIFYHNQYYRWDCRLLGIDTPEIRSEHKDIAIEAREYLRSLIEGKELYIECHRFDKYGRLLVEMFDEDGISISQKMIQSGHAKEYDGGKKPSWD